MTEKTLLDEKVAEIVLKDRPYSPYIKNGNEGFFTQSIANCKRYIEPELLKIGCGILIKKHPMDDTWWICDNVSNGNHFYGFGSTEEIAYCNALLDLKERENDGK